MKSKEKLNMEYVLADGKPGDAGRPEARREQPEAAMEGDVSLEEVIRRVGYPKSWAELICKSLTAEGKTFHWRKAASG